MEHDVAVYGADSPIRNVSGIVVLPQYDSTGCKAGYVGVKQYSSWIALVARGDCKFSTKIKNVIMTQLGRKNEAVEVLKPRHFDYIDSSCHH